MNTNKILEWAAYVDTEAVAKLAGQLLGIARVDRHTAKAFARGLEDEAEIEELRSWLNDGEFMDENV